MPWKPLESAARRLRASFFGQGARHTTRDSSPGNCRDDEETAADEIRKLRLELECGHREYDSLQEAVHATELSIQQIRVRIEAREAELSATSSQLAQLQIETRALHEEISAAANASPSSLPTAKRVTSRYTTQEAVPRRRTAAPCPKARSLRQTVQQRVAAVPEAPAGRTGVTPEDLETFQNSGSAFGSKHTSRSSIISVTNSTLFQLGTDSNNPSEGSINSQIVTSTSLENKLSMPSDLLSQSQSTDEVLAVSSASASVNSRAGSWYLPSVSSATGSVAGKGCSRPSCQDQACDHGEDLSSAAYASANASVDAQAVRLATKPEDHVSVESGKGQWVGTKFASQESSAVSASFALSRSSDDLEASKGHSLSLDGLVDITSQECSDVAELIAWQSAADLRPLGAVRLLRFLRVCRGWRETSDRVLAAHKSWQEEGIAAGFPELHKQPFHNKSVPLIQQFSHIINMNAGFTPEGDTIRIELDGRADMIKLMEIPEDKFCFNWFSMCELIAHSCDTLSHEQGRIVKQITLHDLSRLNVAEFLQRRGVLSRFRKLAGVSTAHFPGCTRFLLVFNTPRAFSALWEVLSKMLPQRVVKKTRIFGHDFSDAIASIVGPDALVALAGMRRDMGDNSVMPKVIDDRRETKSSRVEFRVIAGDMAMAAGRVPAGARVQCRFRVVEGRTTFSMRFFPSDGERATPGPPCNAVGSPRVVSGEVKDEFAAQQAGVLLAMWSNTGDWWSGCRVQDHAWKLSLVSPQAAQVSTMGLEEDVGGESARRVRAKVAGVNTPSVNITVASKRSHRKTAATRVRQAA